MHQIEFYQGARPCLCRLHGSTFWKTRCSLKPPGQEVMGKFEREREGWRTLWCAEIDNIKGFTDKNTLSGHDASIVLCYWMLQPLGWIWSRWLQIEESLSQNELGYVFGKCRPTAHERTIKSWEPIFRGQLFILLFFWNEPLHGFIFSRWTSIVSSLVFCFSYCRRDGNSSISVLIKMLHMAQPDSEMRTALARILKKYYWKICFRNINSSSRCS